MASGYCYTTVENVHLEMTSRCQVACPMCARNDHGGAVRANIQEVDLSIAQFREWFDDAFLRQLSSILLCGNFGDPIVARDCLPIIEHARSCNETLRLRMNTNGSARDRAFWVRLAELEVEVTFAIDGATEESHARYRRGASLSRLLGNAKAFTDAGGVGKADMLVFAHNETEVEDVARLAREAGLRQVKPKRTNRFSGPYHVVMNNAGAEVDRLYPADDQDAGHSQSVFDLASTPITCATETERSIYVSADGYVFPCCWLSQKLPERPYAPQSLYLRKIPGRRRNKRLDSFFAAVDTIGLPNLDLRRRPLARIVDQSLPRFGAFQKPDCNRILTCASVCGARRAGNTHSLLSEAIALESTAG